MPAFAELLQCDNAAYVMPDHRTAHECVTSADGMPDEFPDNVPHNADLVYAIVHAMPDSGHAGQHGPQLWLHVAAGAALGHVYC
ncbi:Uncharacterised protein [Shigella sonnei]|nr:Uncharacterised protein [Shigella sonnei]